MPSEVPHGWSQKPLGQLADIVGGNAFPHSHQGHEGLKYPFVKVSDMNSPGNETVVTSAANTVSQEQLDELRATAYPPGTIVFPKVGAALLTNKRRLLGVPSAFDNNVMGVLSKAADRRFLFHWTYTIDFARHVQPGAVPSVNQATVSSLPVLLPPLPEQKKIAAILSSVDEAIQATQAVIEQTRRVKEGLLQDLLTRGIGRGGLPHTRFKQTEIGEIPESWEVRKVQDLLADVDPAMRSGPFGSALLKSELVEDGIPFLGIDNVHVERFVTEYRRFVSEEKFEELKRYAVRPGDVMITIMGTVGRSCVVPDDVGRALSSKHTWTLTFDPAAYKPYLACAQINHARWVLRHFEADQQGGTMAAIRSETLRSTRLPVPPLSEQEEIEAVLRATDAEARRHEEYLGSLQQTKAGLLRDLLTGKVRVSA